MVVTVPADHVDHARHAQEVEQVAPPLDAQGLRHALHLLELRTRPLPLLAGEDALVEHVEDREQRPVHEGPGAEQAQRPDEGHAAQEAEVQRRVSQRREQAAAVRDDEDEEHDDVRLAHARLVGPQEGREEQHRGAGRPHEAGQHGPHRQERGVRERRPRQRAPEVHPPRDHEERGQEGDEGGVFARAVDEPWRKPRQAQARRHRQAESGGHGQLAAVALPEVGQGEGDEGQGGQVGDEGEHGPEGKGCRGGLGHGMVVERGGPIIAARAAWLIAPLWNHGPRPRCPRPGRSCRVGRGRPGGCAGGAAILTPQKRRIRIEFLPSPEGSPEARRRMQQRLFEDLIESDVVAHKTKQSYTLPVSIALHAIVLVVVVVVPLLTSEELPEPTSAVKAFFVEPAAPPPPPPPPPPPAPKAVVQPKAVATPVPTESPSSRPPSRSPRRSSPRRGSTSASRAACRAAWRAACPAASWAASWAACRTRPRRRRRCAWAARSRSPRSSRTSTPPTRTSPSRRGCRAW